MFNLGALEFLKNPNDVSAAKILYPSTDSSQDKSQLRPEAKNLNVTLNEHDQNSFQAGFSNITSHETTNEKNLKA